MKICVVHVNCEELSGPYTKLIDANFAKAADLTKKCDMPEISRVGYTARFAPKDVDRMGTLFGLPIGLTQ